MIEPNLVGMLMAVGLMVITVALSSWQDLGLSKMLAIATVRTIVQLLGAGVFLAFIFATRQPVAILAVLIGMVTIAATVARSRIDQQLPRLLLWVWLAILISALIPITYVSLLVIRLDPWYDPRYLIALSVMVLGSAMTTTSMTGERLVGALRNNRIEIETHLSLGATPVQAVQAYRQAAIRAGWIPTINAMTMVGLVTLPGTMTGQILAGSDPVTAAIYQILILFMLSLATLIAALVTTHGIVQQFFTDTLQLIEHPTR